MNFKMKLKKAVLAAFAFAALGTGLTGNAHAIDINSGDLVFALYGNTTEFLYDLGPASSLVTPGTSTQFTIPSSVLSQTAGGNANKWTVYGFNFNPDTGDPTTLLSGLTKTPSQMTATEQSHVAIPFGWNDAANQSGQLFNGDGANQATLSSANPNSFTGTFGTSGSLGGTFPVSVEGSFGSTLSIVSGDFNTSALSLIGSASLSSNGSLLTISGPALAPVPVPASLVLFGTGLVGLVGLARRRMIVA